MSRQRINEAAGEEPSAADVYDWINTVVKSEAENPKGPNPRSTVTMNASNAIGTGKSVSDRCYAEEKKRVMRLRDAFYAWFNSVMHYTRANEIFADGGISELQLKE